MKTKKYDMTEYQDEEFECVACGYTSNDKSRFQCVNTSENSKRTTREMMCSVCNNSSVKFAYIYPMQYLGTQQTLFTIAVCTNMIIDEIRGKPP